MKSLLLLTAALALFAFPTSAMAGTYTFTTPTGAAGNTNTNTDNLNEADYAGGANQFDLDHHRAYTWGISITNLAGQDISGATLTFKNIANWDTNANKLFVHLFNSAGTFAFTNGTRSATSNGVTSYVDDAADPQLTILDNFAAANLGANTLNVSTGANNTYLFEASFNMVGQGGWVAQDYAYTFTSEQRAILASYIASGNNIAFGFDPDCHFWNNGVVLTIETPAPQGTSPVPEPVSMVLLGTGLAGLYIRKRRQQN